MKRATQAAILQPTEGEIGAAVGAVAVEHAEAAALIAEDDEILPHQPDGRDRPVPNEVLRERDRLPVAPHEFAEAGLSARARDRVILALTHHRELSEFVR